MQTKQTDDNSLRQKTELRLGFLLSVIICSVSSFSAFICTSHSENEAPARNLHPSMRVCADLAVKKVSEGLGMVCGKIIKIFL